MNPTEFLAALKSFAQRRLSEIRALGAVNLSIAEIELGTGGARVKFKASVEQIAAWELYVELQTRISTQELGAEEGSLREALTSLHAIFGITRQILKSAGPGVAGREESLASYALAILNRVLRPVLAKWHPRLESWEAQRPAGMSVIDHERAWEEAAELRRDLAIVRQVLVGYAEALGILAGVGGSAG
jgi:hypothetical protein